MPKKGHVDRNTAAVIGRIVSVIGGILAILSGIGLILKMEDIEKIAENSPSGELGLDFIVMGIVAILVGIFVLVLELDRIVVKQHLVRGILYIVLFLFAPGAGWILLIGGIIYIVAEFI
ncbi:MAG: hypothetical protein ACE5OZ_00535 [Candidatus Heimdallarchaeota archaeon]